MKLLLLTYLAVEKLWSRRERMLRTPFLFLCSDDAPIGLKRILACVFLYPLDQALIFMVRADPSRGPYFEPR